MAPQTEGSHYFDAEPDANSEPSRVQVDLPDVSFSCLTDTGVFARNALDTGTKLLLISDTPNADDELAALQQQDVHLADVGAGYGPIALAVAHRNSHATVWAIEVNGRARKLCQQNADAAGLRNINVVAPNDVPKEIEFHQIWSNPPIRIGKKALHQLLERWLSKLHSDGSAYLVVQKHLGADSLQKWLNSNGFPTTRYRSQKAFRLLHVTSNKVAE